MRVFRLEDDEGNGVYRGIIANAMTSYWRKYCTVSEASNTHPMPHMDKIFNVDENRKYEFLNSIAWPNDRYEVHQRFGFESVESYKNWVYEKLWRDNLTRGSEVHLCEYEVEEKYAIIGEKQLSFDKRFASLVAVHKPNHFG